MVALQYDFTNMLAPACPGGLRADTLSTAAGAFAAARADVTARRTAGTLGFPVLPEDAALRAALQADALASRMGSDHRWQSRDQIT